MIYIIRFTEDAKKDLTQLKKSDKTAYKKIEKLLFELEEHPRTGLGKPKQLSGNLKGAYSRRITKKHRLVYEIQDDIVMVLVLSVEGHYDDV